MADLFDDAAMVRAATLAPLAQRVRPRTLDELAGQRHVHPVLAREAKRLAEKHGAVQRSVHRGRR